MRRVIAVGLALGLLGAAMVAPAEAGKKKKPVATTLFLHGTEKFGEMESFTLVADAYLKMDSKAPTGTDTKSKGITNYAIGPNSRCAGNTLFPTYVGELSGTVKGDVKVSLNTVASPGAAVEVRIWPDVASLACDSATSEDYIEPAGSAVVALPPGQGTVEAVIKKVNFKAVSGLMLQVSPATMDVAGTPRPLPPFFGRLLYDSEAAPSSVSFSCVPSSGKTCAP